MKLILQIGQASAEHILINRQGAPLTNAQGAQAIDLVYRHWSASAGDALPPNASSEQKASWILARLGDRLMDAAIRQLRQDKQAGVEQAIREELAG